MPLGTQLLTKGTGIATRPKQNANEQDVAQDALLVRVAVIGVRVRPESNIHRLERDLEQRSIGSLVLWGVGWKTEEADSLVRCEACSSSSRVVPHQRRYCPARRSGAAPRLHLEAGYQSRRRRRHRGSYLRDKQTEHNPKPALSPSRGRLSMGGRGDDGAGCGTGGPRLSTGSGSVHEGMNGWMNE